MDYPEVQTPPPEDIPDFNIRSNMVDLKIDVGDTFTLPCQIDKVKGPKTIIWFRVDEEQNPLTQISFDKEITDDRYKERTSVTINEYGSVLTVKDSKPEDEGQYQCRITVKDVPVELTHRVQIRADLICRPENPYALETRPIVDAARVPLLHDIGDNVEIVCRVYAAPMPTVIWSKDGQELRSSHRRKLSHMGHEHTLTIHHMQPRDIGTYICEATNSLGTEKKVIELGVLHDDEPTEIIVNIFDLSSPGESDSFMLVSTKRGTLNIGPDSFKEKQYTGSMRFVQKTAEGRELISQIVNFVIIGRNNGEPKENIVVQTPVPASTITASTIIAPCIAGIAGIIVCWSVILIKRKYFITKPQEHTEEGSELQEFHV